MKRIRFEKPWTVIVEQDGSDPSESLSAADVVVRNHASVVSAGTELAVLSGNESWAKLPYVPGYGSVGTVVSDRSRGGGLTGKLVFTYGSHTEYAATSVVTVEVPNGLAPRRAVFARMGAVSMTALRVSEVELGDRVAVFGAGVVGNLAAQLCALAGARPVVIDTNAGRLEAARRCGLAETIASDEKVVERVLELTDGAGCTTVIEATGAPSVAPVAARCVANHGELILLGSPRGSYTTDITPLLNRVHLCPGVITVKGAHEWRYPTEPSASGYPKHSIRRNVEIVLDLIAAGKLNVDGLLTHHVAPEQAPEVYRGLRERGAEYLGVVFDWQS